MVLQCFKNRPKKKHIYQWRFVSSFIADVELLLDFFNLLCFRRCLNDTEQSLIIDTMVWSDIYLKTINLAIVAVFLYFISLTIAQSTTVKTIENNEFLEVSICISSLVTVYSLSKQQNVLGFFDESMLMLRYMLLTLQKKYITCLNI